MRVLLVSHGYPPEAAAGVELHTQQLAQALAGRHAVAVFCREGAPRAPEFQLRRETVAGLPVWRVNRTFVDAANYADYYQGPPAEAHFRQVLMEWRPDVIHFQHCLGLSAGLPAAARALGVPAALTLHDFWYLCPTVQLRDARGALCPGTHHAPNCFECLRFPPAWLARLRGTAPYRLFRAALPERARVEAGAALGLGALPPPAAPTAEQRAAIAHRVEVMRAALAAPQYLTAPSQYVKDTYVSFGVDAARIQVAPLGLTAPPARPRANAGDGLRVIYLGGRQRHKGITLALEAFRRLPGAAHRLDLYGVAGLDPRFAAEVEALTAADPRAAWRGPYQHADLPGILAAADVLLAPALWPETYSFVAREALLAGVWVIASDLGALPEVVRPGRTGWLAPAGEGEAWARALAEAAAMVAAGGRPAPADFPVLSPDQYADAMLALYAAARGAR